MDGHERDKNVDDIITGALSVKRMGGIRIVCMYMLCVLAHKWFVIFPRCPMDL